MLRRRDTVTTENQTSSIGMCHVPARDIPVPAHLSAAARAYLAPLSVSSDYPPIHDKAAWRAHIKASEEQILPLLRHINSQYEVEVEERTAGNFGIYDITPPGVLPDSDGIVLELHGGGFITCRGELCRQMGIGMAARLKQRVWAVDYRTPPDNPYPTPLDDCVDAYRMLLRERPAGKIVVSGGSAGGNLAAATVLRARDEGLPMPAGVILNTPEVDLTESGDTFHTNNGVDPGCYSLMAVNLLYADGEDLRNPYLSPLFADFSKGFPPTLLTTGTRDLYLSNTVRMHRALRDAGVAAELHVLEAAAHTGFPGSPEGESINRDIRRFIQAVFHDS